MTLCTNQIKNNGCGKCKFEVLSTDFGLNFPLFKVLRLLTNISWMNEFNKHIENDYSVKRITVSCIGRIVIYRDTASKNISTISVLKDICRTIITNLQSSNAIKDGEEESKYLLDKLSIIDNALSINVIRTHLLSTTKNITTLEEYKERKRTDSVIF